MSVLRELNGRCPDGANWRFRPDPDAWEAKSDHSIHQDLAMEHS